MIGWLVEAIETDPYDVSPAYLWSPGILIGYQIPQSRPPPNIWRVILENIEYADNGASWSHQKN